jgi:hypothetical protein
MPLKAQRGRLRAVPIPEFAVAGLVAASLGSHCGEICRAQMAMSVQTFAPTARY